MTHRPTTQELEDALASMPRMLETTKERMRKHFLQGVSLPSLAAQENIRVEGIANAARGVRTRLANPGESGSARRSTPAVPVILQVQAKDLERAFAAMPRISEATKSRIRRFFLEGQSAAQIATTDGIHAETLHNAVRRVRLVLAEQLSPWKGVAVQLVMPAALAGQVQALCLELMQTPHRRRAEQVMKYTFDSLAIARQELKRGKS